MAFFFRNDITWELKTVLDPFINGKIPITQVIGQFVALDTTENIGSKWAQAGGMSRQYPILQWVGGEQESMTFVARIWSARSILDAGRLAEPGKALAGIGQAFVDAGKELASSVGVEVQPDESVTFQQLKQLRLLTRGDNDAGHPPICSFAYGLEVGEQDSEYVVQSISDIKYDEVTSNGTLRGVTCKITLLKYVRFELKLKDATSLEGSTLYKPAKQGDTFEKFAKKYYGAPIKAVNLRRFNREIGAEMATGDVVTVLPAQHSKVTKNITPESIALKDSDEVATLRREKLESRRSSVVSLLQIQ